VTSLVILHPPFQPETLCVTDFSEQHATDVRFDSTHQANEPLLSQCGIKSK